MMNVDSILYALQMHYESQPLSVVAVGVCILVLAYLKPKFMFRAVVGIGCVVLCAMAFTSLNGTLDTGVKGRDTMIETAGK